MLIPATKAELIALIELEHAHLDRCIVALNDIALSHCGIEVGWADEKVAIKDILVHITQWEKRMLSRLAANVVAQPCTEGRDTLDPDEFNRLIYVDNRDAGAQDVLNDFGSTYGTVICTLSELDEAALMQVNTRTLIRHNTYSHYRWAVKKIRPWLRAQK